MMGQRFLQLLADHPSFNVELLFSSSKRAGKMYGEEVKWVIDGSTPRGYLKMRLHEPDPRLLEEYDIDMIFSALPGGLDRDIEMEFVSNGGKVFSNSSSHRMDSNVPILVPEVNGDHIALIEEQESYPEGFIVTNPNCSTTGLAMALEPLMIFEPEKVYVSTYQALSGAGHPGVPSYSIVDNIIPYIEGEEEKMRIETGKIFGEMKGPEIVQNPIQVHPSCARVPVRDGHLISVHMDIDKRMSIGDIEKAIMSMEPIKGLPSAPLQPLILRRSNDRPQHSRDNMAGYPVKGMSVTIGRLRKTGDTLSFFLMVNNTIRGGAGNAILSAELAQQEGYIGGG